MRKRLQDSIPLLRYFTQIAKLNTPQDIQMANHKVCDLEIPQKRCQPLRLSIFASFNGDYGAYL
jgi:hypothetical protein